MKPWRTPVPPQFWNWARWTLHGKQDPRPQSVTDYLKKHGRIPPDWYIHRAWISRRPRPKPPVHPARDLGVYGSGNGYLFTHPGGDAELAVELMMNGFTWALYNVDGIDPGRYSDAIMQAKAHGLIYGPWARVRTPAEASKLEDIGVSWGSEILGHNLETESETTLTPPMLQGVIGRYKTMKRLVITEGWTQNSPDWSALSNVIGMPETFLNVNPNLHPKVCCDHTSAVMNAPSLPLFGAGPMSEGPIPVPPEVYHAEWPGLFAVYPGNGQPPNQWKR